jgi:hypothetical protein
VGREDNTFAAIGILLIAVLIISALVWLAMIALGDDVPPPPPPPVRSDNATSDNATAMVPLLSGKDNCVDVDVRTPRETPLSLKNSYQNHEFLYWVKASVENRCERPLQLTIYVKPNQSELETLVEFDVNRPPFVRTVSEGKSFNAAIDTMFKFIKRDDPTRRTLPIVWVIEDKETGKTLDSGTVQLMILPRNVVNWDLTTPDLMLPKDFLFASLTAWVAFPEPAIRRYANKLAAELPLELPGPAFATAWFEGLYGRFFSTEAENPLLPVNPMREWRQLPPTGEQTILVPDEILERGGRVDAVEATLLLVALTRASGQLKGVPVALFALGGGEQEQPDVLLGWSAGANQWSAVSVSRARELDFQGNLAQSSARLNTLTERYPDINRALNGEGGRWSLGSQAGHGVYIDPEHAVMAIDFEIAAKRYQIRGLP